MQLGPHPRGPHASKILFQRMPNPLPREKKFMSLLACLVTVPRAKATAQPAQHLSATVCQSIPVTCRIPSVGKILMEGFFGNLLKEKPRCLHGARHFPRTSGGRSSITFEP